MGSKIHEPCLASVRNATDDRQDNYKESIRLLEKHSGHMKEKHVFSSVLDAEMV